MGEEPFEPVLAADARLLVAAERSRSHAGGMATAADDPALELGGELVHRRDVAGPDAGGKAVGRVVRLPRDLVQILVALGGEDRAEYLLAHHGHFGLHVDEDGRVDEIAVTAGRVA